MTHTNSTTKLYAQDIPVDTALPLGSHTVSKEEIVNFAQTWDPQGFHLDDDVAQAGYFGEIIASGIHTLGILQRLMVIDYFDHWQIIAGKRIEQLTFNRPVFPNDTLSGTLVVHKVTPDARGRATLATQGTLTNQQGQVVLTSAMEVLVRMRPEGDAA